MASISKCEYLWSKDGEIFRGSAAAGLAFSFFSGRICCLSAGQVTVNCDCCHCMTVLVAPVFSLFLAISICLSFDGLGGMKLKWDLHVVPKRLETGRSSRSSFSGEGNPLPEKLPLGTEQCLLGGCDDAGKMKLSFFSSWAVILRFCFSTVLPVS